MENIMQGTDRTERADLHAGTGTSSKAIFADLDRKAAAREMEAALKGIDDHIAGRVLNDNLAHRGIVGKDNTLDRAWVNARLNEAEAAGHKVAARVWREQLIWLAEHGIA